MTADISINIGDVTISGRLINTEIDGWFSIDNDDLGITKAEFSVTGTIDRGPGHIIRYVPFNVQSGVEPRNVYNFFYFPICEGETWNVPSEEFDISIIFKIKFLGLWFTIIDDTGEITIDGHTVECVGVETVNGLEAYHVQGIGDYWYSPSIENIVKLYGSYAGFEIDMEYCPQPFYFVHITDPHVIAFGTDRWDAVRNEILSWPDKPEFVLCSGDLVDWGADVTGAANFVAFIWSLHTPFPYEWYLDSEHEIPICFCPGNHDSRFIYQLAPPYSLINYRAIVSPLTCYSTKIGNCAIFSMNSGSDYWPWGGFPWPNPFPWDAPGDIMLPEGAGLHSLDVLTLVYNLDSLDGSIDGMDTSDYVKIIMLHHPHVNPNATSGDSEDGVFWNFRDEFKQICNQFGVHLVLCGHLHGKISGGRVWDLNGGYWSPEDGTKCIVTAAVKDYAHRNISIDLIPTLTGNEYEIIEGDMEYVKSTINLDIRGRVDSYVYDDKGNYAGVNETGDGIDLEIPGSFYSRWIVDNETLGINETYIEISVDREHPSGRDDSSDYMFVIEGLADDTMNLTVEVHLKDDNSSKAIYVNVTLFNGSVATLYANNSIVNYTVIINDPDGTTIEVQPTNY